MQNSSLITILKTFSKDEMKSFGLFVESPYFNTSEATTKLYREIRKFYPEFEKKNFTKEYLFDKVYGKGKFNNDLFKKLVSNLIKLSRQFMIDNTIQTREVLKNECLLEQLLTRRLDGEFESEYKRSIEFIKSRPIYHRYFLDYTENNYFLAYHYLNLSDNKKNIQTALESLKYSILFFFTNAYHITSNLNSRSDESKYLDKENVWKITSAILDNPDIFLNVTKTIPKYEDIIGIFQMQYKLSVEPSKEIFLNLKEKIYKSYHKFDISVQRSFVNYLYNTASKITDKTFDINEEKLEIQEFKLENNLFSDMENQMDSVTFVSFLSSYIKNKKYERAEDFVNKYYKRINPDVRESAYNYGLSLTSFYKKDYEKSMVLANKVDQRKYPFNFNARSLMVLNHIEANNTESALYAIDTFKHFLKDNADVTDEYKSPFNNFIKYAALLTKYLVDKNKTIVENGYIEFRKENDNSMLKYNYLKEKFEKILE